MYKRQVTRQLEELRHRSATASERHALLVDECEECRRTAEEAAAALDATRSALVVLDAAQQAAEEAAHRAESRVEALTLSLIHI